MTLKYLKTSQKYYFLNRWANRWLGHGSNQNSMIFNLHLPFILFVYPFTFLLSLRNIWGTVEYKVRCKSPFHCGVLVGEGDQGLAPHFHWSFFGDIGRSCGTKTFERNMELIYILCKKMLHFWQCKNVKICPLEMGFLGLLKLKLWSFSGSSAPHFPPVSLPVVLPLNPTHKCLCSKQLAVGAVPAPYTGNQTPLRGIAKPRAPSMCCICYCLSACLYIAPALH